MTKPSLSHIMKLLRQKIAEMLEARSFMRIRYNERKRGKYKFICI